MFKLLYAGSTSACFELENTEPYYSPEPYTVFLNRERAFEDNRNVFSLFSLRPQTEYIVELDIRGERETVTFKTSGETCAINVRDFGAKGDGVTDDTAAIQTAIHFLPGGGRLYFPEGVYSVLPLSLKSHITLELSEHAVLLGSTRRENYQVLPGSVPDLDGGCDIVLGAFEGEEKPMYEALITAEYAEDITIVGRGAIDGNAQNGDWWKVFHQDPVARPRLVFFNRCKNITMHGVKARNSASWQLHPFFSDNLRFLDVSVSAPKVSPNTDALDPESCDGVEIIGCRFSVGDDCIAIKSGKINMARKYRRPASSHTIRNCLMENGHGAITLGSEASAGVRELDVSQCLFFKTDRGLRIKSRRGRGKYSRIDDVTFENIKMDGVLVPIVINSWYNCVDPDGNSDYVQSREKLPIDDRTPYLGRFYFRNMECTNAEAAACYIDGLTEKPIEAVELSNVSVSFSPDSKPFIPAMQTYSVEQCRLGLYFENVSRVKLENVTVAGADGEKLITKNCGEVTGSVI